MVLMCVGVCVCVCVCVCVFGVCSLDAYNNYWQIVNSVTVPVRQVILLPVEKDIIIRVGGVFFLSFGTL